MCCCVLLSTALPTHGPTANDTLHPSIHPAHNSAALTHHQAAGFRRIVFFFPFSLSVLKKGVVATVSTPRDPRFFRSWVDSKERHKNHRCRKGALYTARCASDTRSKSAPCSNKKQTYSWCERSFSLVRPTSHIPHAHPLVSRGRLFAVCLRCNCVASYECSQTKGQGEEGKKRRKTTDLQNDTIPDTRYQITSRQIRATEHVCIQGGSKCAGGEARHAVLTVHYRRKAKRWYAQHERQIAAAPAPPQQCGSAQSF